MAGTGTLLRVGIAGCGYAARVHLGRLVALDRVRIVGCADPDPAAAEALAALVPARPGEPPAAAFTDHRELLRHAAPDALAVFTPHIAHYRPAMDALQAGCHVFVEKPLSTNLQEAVDVAKLARGRDRKVGVGHQFRLLPSLREARRRLAEGVVGPVRMVTATLAQPWFARYGQDSWRLDPQAAGGGAGALGDTGDHLVDALLWTTGQAAVEASAVQARGGSGFDLVTAAAVKLADGTPVALAISGVSPGSLFELTYFGEAGRLRATETALELEPAGGPGRGVELAEARPPESIDGNFVAAVLDGAPLCCPAEDALATVRLLEAIARSAATGHVVRLV